MALKIVLSLRRHDSEVPLSDDSDSKKKLMDVVMAAQKKEQQPMMNRDRNPSTWDAKGGKTIAINVGGHIQRVNLIELARHPATLLGGIAVAMLEDIIPSAERGKEDYFFDRSNVVFDYILQYYRTGMLHVPDGICPRLFVDELNFWRISPHEVQKCCIEKIPADLVKAAGIPLTPDAFASFHMDTQSHAALASQYKGQRCPKIRCALWKFMEDPASSKFATVSIADFVAESGHIGTTADQKITQARIVCASHLKYWVVRKFRDHTLHYV